jgi:hypothetical protein
MRPIKALLDERNLALTQGVRLDDVYQYMDIEAITSQQELDEECVRVAFFKRMDAMGFPPCAEALWDNLKPEARDTIRSLDNANYAMTQIRHRQELARNKEWCTKSLRSEDLGEI